ncbi:MAG: tRNA (guanosine(37)-N1)-methyltransferase TrmD [Deltaproteobacteria bacterium]|nr:tRNA (guanosine(37)-N1)-methyltransferase TrmD [Deltaproteobacteria bacterium]MBW2497119.1 tRNA (guanosine(37)-N1)-methyltransferase TrmD [Deltaproteobacteria bacterium]
MRIDILTLFPALFEPFLETAFVAVAREQGAAAIEAHDLRAWAPDRHRSVDDEPYGGGPGMVMTPEPLVPAIEALAGPKGPDRRARVVYLSPQGDPLTQSRLTELAEEPALLLVCGRYEGVDQRVLDLAVDEEISIGDYVLSGGELPAMVLVEGIVRLLPGVLGNPESLARESFSGGDLLEGPHYTRPPVYRGLPVPEVLRSGHHAEIERWRRERALARTRERRPDLLDRTEGSTPDPAEAESE